MIFFFFPYPLEMLLLSRKPCAIQLCLSTSNHPPAHGKKYQLKTQYQAQNTEQYSPSRWVVAVVPWPNRAPHLSPDSTPTTEKTKVCAPPPTCPTIPSLSSSYLLYLIITKKHISNPTPSMLKGYSEVLKWFFFKYFFSILFLFLKNYFWYQHIKISKNIKINIFFFIKHDLNLFLQGD